VDIKDVSSRLASQVESICAELVPGGKKSGHEWVYDPPGQGTLSVHLDGPKAGVWAHFGGDGGGDLLDLHVKTKGGTLNDALDWAYARLGIERPSFQGSRPREYAKPQRPAQMKKLEKSGDAESVDWYLRQTRGLTPATLQAFRITEAPWYDFEKDGEKRKWQGPWILFPFLRPQPGGALDLINIKWLHLKREPHPTKPGKTKKVQLQEKNCEPGLFGWQAASPTARKAIICEGEIDAMSGHQLLASIGRTDAIACFSPPAGAGRGEKQLWIEQEFDRLERFDDIVLCFDMDRVGQDKVAMEEMVRRLGVHRCRIMKLALTAPQKDTNDALVAGMTGEEYLAAWTAAKHLSPDELRSASEFVEEVLEEFYPPDGDEPGRRLPWRRMNWVRTRPKEVALWLGINSHGKTIILNQAAMHLCDAGERVCIGSFEMPPPKLLERAVRQLLQRKLPSREGIRAVHRWFDDRLWIVDRIGQMDVKRLLEVFRYARRRFNCTTFVIDSFMRLGIAEDDYNGQKAAMDLIIAFADEEDCHVALVMHSRKLKDTSKAPGRLDARGAGALTDLAQVVFIVWRNEDKEQKLSSLDDDQSLTSAKREEKRADLINKPDAIISVDKQRFGTGKIGHVHLWFEPDSVSFKERQSGELPAFYTVPDDIIGRAQEGAL
jgi:twinkle protein